ncbi:MAG: hypothetical protein JO066_08495 [Verrucomicrobia bacterium]|nr:hypothetical protein [Verrucomicrobiota bacterium]
MPSQPFKPGGPEFIFVGEHPSIDFANAFFTPKGQEKIVVNGPELTARKLAEDSGETACVSVRAI